MDIEPNIFQSIVGFIKLVVSGYFLLKNPTSTTTRMFFNEMTQMFEPNRVTRVQRNMEFDQITNLIYNDTNTETEPANILNVIQDLDETKDKPCSENDSDDVCCIVCSERKRNVVLIPCSHSVTCIRCVKQISSTTNKCPVCRSEIVDKIFYFN